MRKSYIDNIRFLTVLLLFPYHTCMIYNTFGESFYVRGPQTKVLNNFICLTYPWFMPILFVIAGISTAYALKKRTAGLYVKERISKLLVPFIFGLLLYVPAQTYFAERYHNNYTGGYFAQYKLFFTKASDLTGYAGGFTPGQLWFILFLFVISIIALPIMLIYNKSKHQINGSRLKMTYIIPLFLIPMIMFPVVNFGDKSLGEDFALFLLGFFILSKEEVLERLDRYRWQLLAVSLVVLAVHFVLYYKVDTTTIQYSFLLYFIRWVSVLTILGMGRHYLNLNNKLTAYLSKASFPVYVFHQTWLVLVAFYVFKLTDITALQVILIIAGSVCLTFINYEIFRRIPVTRFMFGIKK